MPSTSACSSNPRGTGRLWRSEPFETRDDGSNLPPAIPRFILFPGTGFPCSEQDGWWHLLDLVIGSVAVKPLEMHVAAARTPSSSLLTNHFSL